MTLSSFDEYEITNHMGENHFLRNATDKPTTIKMSHTQRAVMSINENTGDVLIQHIGPCLESNVISRELAGKLFYQNKGKIKFFLLESDVGTQKEAEPYLEQLQHWGGISGGSLVIPMTGERVKSNPEGYRIPIKFTWNLQSPATIETWRVAIADDESNTWPVTGTLNQNAITQIGTQTSDTPDIKKALKVFSELCSVISYMPDKITAATAAMHSENSPFEQAIHKTITTAISNQSGKDLLSSEELCRFIGNTMFTYRMAITYDNETGNTDWQLNAGYKLLQLAEDALASEKDPQKQAACRELLALPFIDLQQALTSKGADLPETPLLTTTLPATPTEMVTVDLSANKGFKRGA